MCVSVRVSTTICICVCMQLPPVYVYTCVGMYAGTICMYMHVCERMSIYQTLPSFFFFSTQRSQPSEYLLKICCRRALVRHLYMCTHPYTYTYTYDICFASRIHAYIRLTPVGGAVLEHPAFLCKHFNYFRDLEQLQAHAAHFGGFHHRALCMCVCCVCVCVSTT
jgi:hypothetical protein